MTKPRRKSCKRCNAPAGPERQLSHNGYCFACGMAVAMEAAQQMRDHSGPHYDHWLASNARGAPGGRGDTPLEVSSNKRR